MVNQSLRNRDKVKDDPIVGPMDVIKWWCCNEGHRFNAYCSPSANYYGDGNERHIKYFWYHMCKNPNLREFEENSFNRIRNTNWKGQLRRLILADLYLKISADKFSSVCVEH